VVRRARHVGPARVVELHQVVHLAEDLGQAQPRGRREAELAVVVLDASVARGVASGRLAAVPQLIRLGG
jgi:hypothetical protein